MLEMRLYLLQRISALVMAPLVLGHLALMIYAVQGGLSVGEILGRTQGSLFWGLFYGLFVIAVSVHAALGLRIVAQEWLGFGRAAMAFVGWGSFVGFLCLGLRAVWLVTAP